MLPNLRAACAKDLLEGARSGTESAVRRGREVPTLWCTTTACCAAVQRLHALLLAAPPIHDSKRAARRQKGVAALVSTLIVPNSLNRTASLLRTVRRMSTTIHDSVKPLEFLLGAQCLPGTTLSFQEKCQVLS